MLSLLRTLGAVERTALLAVLDALRVEHAADDVIANARKVFHAATADQHDRVFLKVVTFSGDVRSYFKTVCKSNSGNFSNS